MRKGLFGFSGPQAGVIASVRNLLQTPAFKVVRVTSVNLGQDTWGGLGSIQYISLDNKQGNTPNSSIAYPLFTNLKNYPIQGELVLVLTLPNNGIGDDLGSEVGYYLTTVNIWNHPHYNGYPTEKAGSEVGQVSFTEKGDIAPILPFEGDFIVEGSFGNAIRLGSSNIDKATKQPLNTWSSDSKTGDPLIILHNSSNNATQGWVPTVEDINQDPSSIYLTTTQTIGLTPAYFPTELSYLKPPSRKYNNSQAVINADRVVVNSKKDEVLVMAKTTAAVAAQEVHVEGKSQIVLGSPKVLLAGQDASHPALKGDQTIEQLKQLTVIIEQVLKVLTELTVPIQDETPSKKNIRLRSVNIIAKESIKALDKVNKQLDGLASKTVFLK